MTEDIDRMSDVQALQAIYDILIADHHHSYFKYMTRLWCIIDGMQRQAVAEAAKPPPRTRTGYFTCHHEPWQLEVYAHNPRPAAEGAEMTKDIDHMPELPPPVLDSYWRGGVEIVRFPAESAFGQEHMAGQISAGIDPSYSNTQTRATTAEGSMNIKEELLIHIGQRDAVYVSIRFENLLTDREIEVEGTLDTVLPQVEALDYDAGHVSQRLFGHIWYADGTWSDRAEYDGSEWWVHRVRPPCKLDTTQKEA